MSLKDYCQEENLVWTNLYAKAFRADISDEITHTVIRYQIPFDTDTEMIFLERFQMAPSRRVQLYQNLVKCIQQEVKASTLLAQSGVLSILQFFNVEQEREPDGISYIYLETEEIWPIRQKLLVGEVDRTTAINVITRLSIILRDIAKEPHQIVMRGFDINEVYVNKEDRILLGGFYYAASPALPPPPDYLPGHPLNLTEAVLQGATGTPGSDMYALACLAWNLFSSIPMDAQLPAHIRVYPQYGSEELAEVLLLGREGRDEDLATFRRRLGDCRKRISKDENATLRIPVREHRRVLYEIDYV